MSGIDEQYKDVPVCPVCNRIPDYWLVTVSKDGYNVPALWVYSRKYIMRELPEEQQSNVGEGCYDFLNKKAAKDFISMTCLGTKGCGSIFYSDAHITLFNVIRRIFNQHFPKDIRKREVLF